MTNYEFFKLAERVEDLARHLYLALADHGSTPPGLRVLFLGLAEEEEEHGRRLQVLAASLHGSPWANQIVEAATAGIEAAALEFEVFLVEVKTRRQPGDLPRILDRLARMEERRSFVHAEELARGAGPGAARLFESMARQDQHHRKLLERVRQGQPAARALA